MDDTRRDEFKAAIGDSLDQIDRWLAEAGLPPPQRPMQAAIDFVRFCIQRVSTDGSEEGEEPGEFGNYATAPWFRIVYRHVSDWYRERYGPALEVDDRRINAVVHILSTPFLLKVPTTTKEPGEPGVSFWLCYHDRVRDNENPLDWVEAGPNLATLAVKEVAKARRLAREIATDIRAIFNLMLGMKTGDQQMQQLRDGIIPHLERAAEGLAKATVEAVKAAHWDMQMACELALKCLTQQRAGSFTETHDLFVLYDRMPGDPLTFRRSELSKLPNWERMAELRYGGGLAISAKDALRTYRATLRIVRGAVEGLQKSYRMGSAKFHLKRPPWLEE